MSFKYISGRESRIELITGLLILSLVVSLLVLLIGYEVVIDFSPGRVEKWLAVCAAFGLFVILSLFLKRGKAAFCLLLPPLLSLNFVLITVGINAEEYLANNQIGYRPWILIYDFLLVAGLIISIASLNVNRIDVFIKAAFLPVVLFGSFILVGAVSLIFADDILYVWFGLFVFAKFLIWFLIFLLIFINDIHLLKFVTWGLAGFVVFQFIVSLIQVFRIPTVEKLFEWPEDIFVGQGGVIRVGGTVGRAHLESMLILIIPILFAYGTSRDISARQRKLMMICGMLGIILVFLTGSRGPIVSAIVGTAVALRYFLLLKTRKTHLQILLVIAVASIIGFAIVLQSGELTDTLLRRTHSFRLETFEIAARMIVDHPLLGVGLNNYLVVGPDYGIAPDIITFGRPVHNQFLLAAAETGLIGLVIFILNLVYWWWITIRASFSCRALNLCWFPYGVQGSLVALVLSSLLDAPLIKPPVFSVLAILVSGVSALAIYRLK